MINFDGFTRENTKEHNWNLPQIPDHPYEKLIIGVSWFEKTNASLNLTSRQADIDKMYLYAKDPYDTKYQLLIGKRKNVSLKRYNGSKALLNTQIIWIMKIMKIMKTAV